ncbi:SDR family oxidoreductase [Biostraticola tofi]|uniref:3-oxoacyl-[acyl-carrier protein] reductase n=1 Tax=Biostraticola tofi TaxID=466109 RepID=A0A4R3YQC0_9GAMM|nr:SDR family oxidoreductase [Biostraticola tofi]TCV95105.1 3-oxoacyl-[acyl-carrier protein] reductase [Biostraticola tofi]
MTYSEGRVALVTGGSRGIGAEISKRLAADGFIVAVNYLSNLDAATAVVDEIVSSGGNAFAVAADISSLSDVAAMFATVEKRSGPIAVLVNNAGIMELAPIANMDAETFDRMVSINFTGTFNSLQQAARQMAEGGRVINISSSLTRLKLPTYGPYAATKAAVETLTAIFSRELKGRNITVNAVAPGPTATELFFKGKSDQLISNITRMAPLERLGRPEDIAAVVSFLAGPDGAWVNGQTLFANGGAI